jgi:hypothetical protein
LTEDEWDTILKAGRFVCCWQVLAGCRFVAGELVADGLVADELAADELVADELVADGFVSLGRTALLELRHQAGGLDVCAAACFGEWPWWENLLVLQATACAR